MQEQNTDKVTMIIVGVIALIVGFLLGWIANGGDSEPKATTGEADKTVEVEETGTTTPSETETTTEEVSGGDVTVESQAAGKVVTIAEVAADGDTWIAVRDDVNGKPGNILGAKRVSTGTHTAVSIPLLRATESGKSYIIVLFTDNGDKKFDHKTDRPVLSQDSSELLAVKFKAN